MRSRFASWTVSVLSLSIFLAMQSRGRAQIEFAHSTVRLTSATEPIATTQRQTNDPASAEPSASNAEDPAPALNAPANQPSSNQFPTSTLAQPAAAPPNGALNRAPTPLVEPPYKKHSKPLVNPYTSASAQTTMSKMPRPMPVQSNPAPPPMRLRGKPFQSVQSEPAISPYLNLYRNDAGQNQLLNYYTLVRPQLDQMEANKKQAAEMQKLRAQVQNGSQRGGVQQTSAIDPNESEGMTVSAHYMDTAQFYHRIRK